MQDKKTIRYFFAMSIRGSRTKDALDEGRGKAVRRDLFLYGRFVITRPASRMHTASVNTCVRTCVQDWLKDIDDANNAVGVSLQERYAPETSDRLVKVEDCPAGRTHTTRSCGAVVSPDTATLLAVWRRHLGMQ